MCRVRTWLAIVVVCCSGTTWAAEPNETFGQATILGPGVLSIVDDLTLGTSGDYPDTMVASLNTAGFIIAENDDGGPWEGSLGSGLMEIPINNDSSFWFIVTGNPDFGYSGAHDEAGEYHVYVDIYDDFGDYVETHEFDDALAPGEVDQFALEGFNTNYTYDVLIDNTVGGASDSDVDFFTFTGLTAGASFSAEVLQSVPTGFDSILGWFDASGNLLVADDDGGATEGLSLVAGTVPVSGTLTFAVTGYDDFDFVGLHGEEAEYSLQLTLGSVAADGDFDSDGDVDGRDFLKWQRGGSPSPLSAGDLADWRANYGAGSLAAVVAVPEPAGLVLFAMAMCIGGVRRRRC